MKKHWVSFVLMFLGYAVGIIAADILRPLVFKEIIDAFSSGLNREIILGQAMHFVFLIFLIVVVYNIGYRSGDFAGAHFQSNVMKRLYDFTFERLMQHSYHFFSNNFSGSIIAKSKRFIKQFETLADIVGFQIWFSIVILSGIMLILFFKAPLLAYVFLIWSILYILLTCFFIRKKMHYDSLEASADSLVTGRFSDAILNILNIKIFSSDKKEKINFELVTDDERKKRSKAWFLANLQNVFQSFMMGVLTIVVLFLTVRLWYGGKLSLGTVVLVQLYMSSLFDILWNLGRSLTRAMKAMTDMQEVIDLFDTPIDILDPKKPESLRIREGRVVFKDVSFAYKGGNSVLQNFNLNIAPGERIGLVGHSGAGKSTITKLLLRFVDISEGDILIDGQNIKNVTQNDLRSVISFVPQESILFHRTIRENIAYSRLEATNEEVENIAKKSFAHDFIIKFPKGYDTLVGERGIKLSGGERQRIAIARAMLKNSPILVLDEATSSLDSVSEKYIQDGFEELMKGKTTIVIAHRLSTISKMDKIVVLENGNIAEMGSHRELLDRGGVYAGLWGHQSGGFLEE